MIRHIVLFKLKPSVSRDDPRVVQWMDMMRELSAKIPTSVDWEFGWNITDRPIAQDFGLNSSFRTREDLAAYLPHPDHQAMVAVAKQVADWVICDFEL